MSSGALIFFAVLTRITLVDIIIGMSVSSDTQSIRMYFAGSVLPGLFFSRVKEFGNLIFVAGDEKQKRLASLYEDTRKQFQEVSVVLEQNGKPLPLDLNTPVGPDGFLVQYLHTDDASGAITVLIGLPRPELVGESWAIIVKYPKSGTGRFFSVEFSGYRDLSTKSNSGYLVTEFVSASEKKQLGEFDNFNQAVSFISDKSLV